MNVLIVKLGATGDVVRTTPLLHRLSGSVTWITAAKNGVLLDGLAHNLRYFSWEERSRALDTPYDLAINLEDTLEVALFLKESQAGRDLRRLRRLVQPLALHRQLEVLVRSQPDQLLRKAES